MSVCQQQRWLQASSGTDSRLGSGHIHPWISHWPHIGGHAGLCPQPLSLPFHMIFYCDITHNC